jgi:high-affinity iron transporter
MIFGAFLLTTMIIWMFNQKNIAKDLENRVVVEVSKTHKLGLFFLVFISILREGIESVIFLSASRFASGKSNLIGATLGILTAIVLGYLIFISSIKINIRKFFVITSIVLILFAAGLVALGVHELQEAQIIPLVAEHVWDINPTVNLDGSYPLLHEQGYVGSILKGLFGYNGNPSLIEIIGYVSYLAFVFIVWIKMRMTPRKIVE